MGLTSPTGSLVCVHARHPRSMRGWPRCCSPAAKVPQVECAGDDDAEDEKHLYEDDEPVPMTGDLNRQENQHPEREGHTQWEPLRLRYSLHSWYRLPVRSRPWALSLSPSRAAVTAPRRPGQAPLPPLWVLRPAGDHPQHPAKDVGEHQQQDPDLFVVGPHLRFVGVSEVVQAVAPQREHHQGHKRRRQWHGHPSSHRSALIVRPRSGSSITAHRSPLTAHRSPLTAHRSPHCDLWLVSVPRSAPPRRYRPAPDLRDKIGQTSRCLYAHQLILLPHLHAAEHLIGVRTLAVGGVGTGPL